MSENERKEFVDELLDASLRRYSQVEPRAGLEEHLLASVPQQAQRFAWPHWAWLPAAATAVAVLAVVAFYPKRQAPVLTPPSVARQAPAPSLPAAVLSTPAPGPAARPVAHREPVERAAIGPRLASFPARAPLSEQERLLLLFMQQAPKEQLVARQLDAGPIERLEFKPLTVPPLESSKSTTEN